MLIFVQNCGLRRCKIVVFVQADLNFSEVQRAWSSIATAPAMRRSPSFPLRLGVLCGRASDGIRARAGASRSSRARRDGDRRRDGGEQCVFRVPARRLGSQRLCRRRVQVPSRIHVLCLLPARATAPAMTSATTPAAIATLGADCSLHSCPPACKACGRRASVRVLQRIFGRRLLITNNNKQAQQGRDP